MTLPEKPNDASEDVQSPKRENVDTPAPDLLERATPVLDAEKARVKDDTTNVLEQMPLAVVDVQAADGFKKLLSRASDWIKESRTKGGDVPAEPQRPNASFKGDRAALVGFDPVSGNAVLRTGNKAEMRPVANIAASDDVSLTDDKGNKYQKTHIAGSTYYRSQDGALLTLGKDKDGAAVLNADRSLLSVPQNSRDLVLPADRAERRPAPGESVPRPALQQSNDYATRNRLDGPIDDGFRTAGQGVAFDGNGAFGLRDRAATVVDRKNDQKLNEAISEAKQRFGHLPPQERAEAIAKFAHELMTPPDLRDKPNPDAERNKRYREFMKEHGGESLQLGEFFGKGACTQEALLTKVLADELGLKASLVRGNEGSHAWTNFDFGDGKEKIFDARSGVFGIDADKSEFHRPSKADTTQLITAPGSPPGDQVVGYDTTTGGAISEHRNVENVSPDQLEPGQKPEIGGTVKLKAEGQHPPRQMTVEGVNPDGTLRLSATERQLHPRESLTAPPLELGNPDLDALKANWPTLVTNNKLLTDKQKSDLEAARLNLEHPGTKGVTPDAIKDFKRLVEGIGALKSSPSPEARVRAESLARLAESVGRYPDRVFVPVERVIAAKDAHALDVYSQKLNEVARHMVDPITGSGGDRYEHYASQGLQKALRNGNLKDGNWTFVPGAKGSATDHMKIDGFFFDLDGGKVVPTDFAMERTSATNVEERHGKYMDKVEGWNERPDGRRVRVPASDWALTVDVADIGYKGRGPVNEANILKRVNSYLDGTQPRELGLSITQRAPHKYPLVEAEAGFGGRATPGLPTMIPIQDEVTRAVQERVTGRPYKQTQNELADIGHNLTQPEASSFPSRDLALLRPQPGFAQRYSEASSHQHSVFVDGLRAAVEARHHKLSPKQTPELNLTTGTNGRSNFVEFTAPDDGSGRGETKIRIHHDGSTTLQFEVNGQPKTEETNVREVGEKISTLLGSSATGLQPQIDALLKTLNDPRAFNRLKIDLQNAKDGSVADREAFLKSRPELRTLCEATQFRAENERAAQIGRTGVEVAAEIASRLEWSSRVPPAEREQVGRILAELHENKQSVTIDDAIRIHETQKLATPPLGIQEAKKIVDFGKQLHPTSSSWDTKQTFDEFKKMEGIWVGNVKDYGSHKRMSDVYRIVELEGKLGVDAKTATEIYSVGRHLKQPATAEQMKEAAELHKELAKHFKKVKMEQSAGVYEEIGRQPAKLQADEIKSIAEAIKNAPKLPIAETTQVGLRTAEMERCRPLVEKAKEAWTILGQGEVPKSYAENFGACLDMAMEDMRKEAKAGNIRPEQLAAMERLVKDYSTVPERAQDLHDFFQAPKRTGQPGEALWQAPQSIPQDQRAAVEQSLARFGKNPLAERAAVDGFVAALDAKVKTWNENLQPQAQEVADLQRQAQQAEIALKQLALAEAGNVAGAERLLKNPQSGSPEFANAHKEFTERTQAAKQASEALNKKCEERARELQREVSEFAKKHGLPPVELKLVDHVGAAGALYSRGKGEILVSRGDLLNKAGGAELVGNIYHELVHAQQDAVVSRNVMDQMKLDKGFSDNPTERARQMEDFRNRYNEATGARLAADDPRWQKFADDVAKQRDGKPLTDQERQKAEALSEAFKKATPFGERYEQIGNSVATLEKELSGIRGAQSDVRAAEDLISRLAKEGPEGDKLRAQFFGDKAEGPLKDLVDSWKKARKDGSGRALSWDEAAARDVISKHIAGDGKETTGRINALNAEAREAHAKYMQLHEQEAHLIASRVHERESRNQLDATYQLNREAVAPSAVPGEPRVGEKVKVQGRDVTVAGFAGENAVVHNPASAAPAELQPITDADLKAKYEEIKVVVDGKEVTRYVEKGHPENGLFAVTDLAGEKNIARDTSFEVMTKGKLQEAKAQAPATAAPSAPQPATQTDPARPDAVRPEAARPVDRAPERGPAPSPERLAGTRVEANSDGTLKREGSSVGDTFARELSRQDRISTEQIDAMKNELKELEKDPKQKDKVERLRETIHALEGKYGPEVQLEAHRGMIEAAGRRAREGRWSAGTVMGSAVGLSILACAALGWLAERSRTNPEPLSRARVTGR